MKTQKFKIARETSNIHWVGRKVTGAHNGTIDIKEGELIFTNGQLTGGAFVVDTTSIKILDITDPATNAQFAGHLASEDFFNSVQYPESTFQITTAEPRGDGSYHVSGLLTIKDIVQPVTFDAQINLIDQIVTASGKLTIDRTKFGIKFRSGNFFKDLGDTLIYNSFDMHVTLNSEVAAEVLTP